jgi:lipopolysaccharide/colanic/teichoic acid biosynthesis glycosyltransferase
MLELELATEKPRDRTSGPPGWYHAVARARDVVLAAALLIALAPLLLVVVVAIKLDSSGPVIFSQERTGSRRRRVGGRHEWRLEPFRVHKFRSMVPDADSVVHRLHIERLIQGAPADGSETGFKLAGDARVTRVGRWLRRWSIDELPQLFNVLTGEMSLVGPRPVPRYEAAHYAAWRPERFGALPGLTGLWQVRGRCLLSPREMAELDAEYVGRQSLRLDLAILVRTLPAVLSGRGAA